MRWTYNAGAIRRRVADLAPLQHRQLAFYPRCRIARSSDNMKRTNAFSVQSSILSEALSDSSLTCVVPKRVAYTHLADEHRHAALLKVSNRACISVKVATCKSLICAIKECKMALLEYHLRNFLPLFAGRVHTSGVMRTRVKEEHRALWRGRKGI